MRKFKHLVRKSLVLAILPLIYISHRRRTKKAKKLSALEHQINAGVKAGFAETYRILDSVEARMAGLVEKSDQLVNMTTEGE